MDQFKEIESFVTVAQLGSFVQAADKLGLSKAMVSRHVSELEARLGVRLMQRTTRRLSLSEAGAEYLQRCVQILAELEDANAAVSASAVQAQGLLKITAPLTFGIRHLAEHHLLGERVLLRHLRGEQPDGNQLLLAGVLDRRDDFGTAVAVPPQVVGFDLSGIGGLDGLRDAGDGGLVVAQQQHDIGPCHSGAEQQKSGKETENDLHQKFFANCSEKRHSWLPGNVAAAAAHVPRRAMRQAWFGISSP